MENCDGHAGNSGHGIPGTQYLIKEYPPIYLDSPLEGVEFVGDKKGKLSIVSPEFILIRQSEP